MRKYDSRCRSGIKRSATWARRGSMTAWSARLLALTRPDGRAATDPPDRRGAGFPPDGATTAGADQRRHPERAASAVGVSVTYAVPARDADLPPAGAEDDATGAGAPGGVPSGGRVKVRPYSSWILGPFECRLPKAAIGGSLGLDTRFDPLRSFSHPCLVGGKAPLPVICGATIERPASRENEGHHHRSGVYQSEGDPVVPALEFGIGPPDSRFS